MTTIEGAEMNDADMQKVTEALRQHRAEHWTQDLWTCACEPDFWRRHAGRQGHLAQAVLAALDLPVRDARVRADALAPVWAVVDEWESMAGESDRVGTIGGDAAARNFRRLADQLRTAIGGGSGE